MSRQMLLSVLVVGLAGVAVAGSLSIEIEDGERWWGGLNARGSEMPYGRDSLVSEDLARDHRCNVGAPLLLSSHGRYVWSDEPFAYVFSNGTLTVTGRSSTPTCGRPAADLRGAFAFCSRTFFPPKGKAPPDEFFATPQWNTWIELTYDQNEKDILAYAEAIVAHGFKPGLLMIDDTWQSGYGTWTFDAGRFRDPKALCDRLHALGFKVMLWTCPFVSMDSPAFRTLEKDGGLVLRTDGRAAPTRWWNGCSALLDLTHPNGARWFADALSDLQSRFGVDGFKFDAGDVEYYNGDDARTHLGEFVTAETLPAVAHTQKYVRFGARWRYNEFRAAWGAAGEPAVVRLCDKNHAWREVRRLIPDLIATGLLGYPFVCPDMIGGGNWKTFLPGSAFDPELFVRSAQVHALAPMAQFSAAPWRVLDARHLSAVRKAMEIRERFSARIVDLARACATSGEPMLRNLEYAYPGLGYADVVDAFMLGDFLLVAPQVEKGAASRSVRLPPGRWRADDGMVHEGPKTLEVETPLERLPYFEKLDAARLLTANLGDLGGTDHLGRMLPSHAEVGDVRPNRQVGLFYYLWLGQHGTQGPYDVSKMEAADPQVLDKPDSPLWPDPSTSPMLHWGEPLFGYYQSTDEWVLRRHVEYGMPHWLILQDEYNQEASRDIEPMRGGYRDAYYFQLMDFVRRFKGLPPPTVARKGDVVAYVEPTGDLAPRNHPGYDACGVYRNETGRNEFARLFVSCDGEAVSFAAQTVADLTPCADATWMNLLVRVPGRAVDAMGYTHVVTNGAPDVTCRVTRREVAYRLPLRVLGLDGRKDFSLEFKWSDNRQADDPMDFYVNGDSAPRGRLNWLFRYDERN